jgi:arabinogalactan oligomer/maltooligosaccharide transport system permease protein
MGWARLAHPNSLCLGRKTVWRSEELGQKHKVEKVEMKKSSENILHKIGAWFAWFGQTFKKGDILTKLSFPIMGLSNLCRGQVMKGLIFLSMELGFLFYLILAGFSYAAGIKSLGTVQQDKVFNEATGIYDVIKGDNSMLVLLYGVTTVFIIIAFIAVWKSNIKSAIKAQELKEAGKPLPSFFVDVKELFNTNMHKTLLFFPTLGLVLFTVLPLVFMILIAFTNFDSEHQPPGNLFTWVGLKNFKTILFSGEQIGKTFWPILEWTIIWAVFATFLNYIFGMLLAILINKKEVKLKKLWRTVFVLSVAVPLFVSLLAIRLIFAESGSMNMLLKEIGFIDTSLPFWTNATWARVTVIIVNLWVGIPHTMLITTGILMNIPADLYESAKIDGAGPAVIFFKITLPYMMFVTTPYLITQFIGNINNFNVIYFLSAGAPTTVEYYKGAGKTDLLVTWLYKLTADNKDYSYASTIGIFIFIICATFSLITYRRTGSYKNEEGFQ